MNHPSASTDRVPSTLPYGRPGPLGVGAVEDGVGTVDHGGILSLAGTGVRNVEAVGGLLVSRIVDSLLFSGAAQQSDLEIHLHEYEANQ